MFWAYIITGLVLFVSGLIVLVYKREHKRVQDKLDDTDESQEDLMKDYRGRAVRRIHQINQLRKSPSKLKIALKKYIDKSRSYREVLKNSESGDGLRSLHAKQDPLHMPSRPLIHYGDDDGKGTVYADVAGNPISFLLACCCVGLLLFRW